MLALVAARADGAPSSSRVRAASMAAAAMVVNERPCVTAGKSSARQRIRRCGVARRAAFAIAPLRDTGGPSVAAGRAVVARRVTETAETVLLMGVDDYAPMDV